MEILTILPGNNSWLPHITWLAPNIGQDPQQSDSQRWHSQLNQQWDENRDQGALCYTTLKRQSLALLQKLSNLPTPSSPKLRAVWSYKPQSNALTWSPAHLHGVQAFRAVWGDGGPTAPRVPHSSKLTTAFYLVDRKKLLPQLQLGVREL